MSAKSFFFVIISVLPDATGQSREDERGSERSAASKTDANLAQLLSSSKLQSELKHDYNLYRKISFLLRL